MAKNKNDKMIAEAKKRLEEVRVYEEENRVDSVDDLRFVNGEQWDVRDIQDRENNGRPCLVINKLIAVVDQIVNEGRKNTPSIKVRPYDKSSDPATAQVLTGLVKNIENESDADAAYDFAFECAVKGGWGYIRVLTEYADDEVFEQDIRIKRVENQYSIYIDPNAKKPDRSDMKWALVVDKMPKEEFEEQYPKKVPISLDVLGTGHEPENESDHVYIAEYWYMKPEQRTLLLLADGKTVWEDEAEFPKEFPNPETGELEPIPDALIQEFIKDKRTVEYNKVYWCTISGEEILEEVQEWAGKYIPIVPVFGREVWIEGKLSLQSAIRHAKDPQRLFNWARSTTAETVAMAPKQPYIVTAEQIEGHEDQWANLNRVVTPYLVYNESVSGKAPQRQGASIPDTGALQEAMTASDDIKSTTGMYDASLGAQGNETSGRAILARQNQGQTGTFNYHDNLARAIKQVGRIVVDLIPYVYDTERQVRILGQDQKEKIVMVNQKMPDGTVNNDILTGKYDVVIDVGAGNLSTTRMESADALTNILQTAPQLSQVLLPRLIKLLDMPDSDEIAEEINKVMNPQQQQGPTPEQQMMEMKQGMEQMKGEIIQQKGQIELQKGQMELKKGQQDLQKGQLDLEGKRIDNAQSSVDLQNSMVDEDAKMVKVIEATVANTIKALTGA